MMEQNTNKNQMNSIVHNIGIDSSERDIRLAFMNFTQQDALLLKELLPLIKHHSVRIVDKFYENVERHPELNAIIRDAGSTIDRLKASQIRYLEELVMGEYGEAYFERRLRIGVIHNKIGLGPRWYLGSYSVYSQNIIPLIMKKYRFRPAKRLSVLNALNKVLYLDAQLAMETYIQGLMDDLNGVSTSKEVVEKAVSEYGKHISRIAIGDLSQRIDVKGEGDLAQLGIDLNTMTDSLVTMTQKVAESGNAMSGTVAELQSTVNQQSASAAEQASSVNETTSTLAEIKATSTQNLEKAQALGQAAERTRAEGEKGLESIEVTTAGMIDIRKKVEDIAENILGLSERTQQIGDITATVSNLAQQLKMLALNASIEAGKAGEAGKGFSVVASEVKELAEQSQQATGQVQKILQDIQHATDRAVMVTEEGSKGVDAGMNSIQQTGETIRELTSVIRETTLASQQIVAAVRQEVSGIEQITTAMNEINKVTAQFVSATQQTKSASDGLGDIAKELVESAAVYKF